MKILIRHNMSFKGNQLNLQECYTLETWVYVNIVIKPTELEVSFRHYDTHTHTHTHTIRTREKASTSGKHSNSDIDDTQYKQLRDTIC